MCGERTSKDLNRAGGVCLTVQGADQMSASVERATFSVSIDKYRAYHSLTTAALDESLGDNVLIMLNL